MNIQNILKNIFLISKYIAKIYKLFSSSKSFWSVTYLLIPFLISQIIAITLGERYYKIISNLKNSEFPTWINFMIELISEYFKDGGDWETVGIILFIIILMVFVKLIEKEEKTKHGFLVFSSFILIFLILWFYILPKNTISNMILSYKYAALRQSVRESKNDKEIIKRANKILHENNITDFRCTLDFKSSNVKMSINQLQIMCQILITKNNIYVKMIKNNFGVDFSFEENNCTQLSTRRLLNQRINYLQSQNNYIECKLYYLKQNKDAKECIKYFILDKTIGTKK